MYALFLATLLSPKSSANKHVSVVNEQSYVHLCVYAYRCFPLGFSLDRISRRNVPKLLDCDSPESGTCVFSPSSLHFQGSPHAWHNPGVSEHLLNKLQKLLEHVKSTVHNLNGSKLCLFFLLLLLCVLLLVCLLLFGRASVPLGKRTVVTIME